MMLCKSPSNPEAEIVKSTYFCIHVCAVGLCMSHYTCGSQDKSAFSYQMGTWVCCGIHVEVRGQFVIVSSLLVPGIKLNCQTLTSDPCSLFYTSLMEEKKGRRRRKGVRGAVWQTETTRGRGIRGLALITVGGRHCEWCAENACSVEGGWGNRQRMTFTWAYFKW